MQAWHLDVFSGTLAIMATRIVGINLGASTVQLSYVEVGLRSIRVLDVYEHTLVPSGERGEPIVFPEELKTTLHQRAWQPSRVVIGIQAPGMVKTLLFPFAETKKIEQALPTELESELLAPLEEQLLDFHVSKPPVGHTDTPVLVGIASRKEIQALLDLCNKLGWSCDRIGASSLGAAGWILASDKPPTDLSWAVLDVGPQTSHLCVLWNRTSLGFTRTIVHPDWLQESSLSTSSWQRLGQEIRSTWHKIQSSYGIVPNRLLLTGMATPALQSALAEWLGCSVSLAPVPAMVAGRTLSWSSSLSAETIRVYATSMGLALSAVRPLTQFNFAGRLYKERSTAWGLRGSSIALAGLALLLSSMAVFAATWHDLRKEHVLLEQEARKLTQTVVGKELVQPSQIQTELNQMLQPSTTQIPAQTALQVLEKISMHTPRQWTPPGQAATPLQLDVLRFDVQPQKLIVKVGTDRADALSEWINQIKSIACVKGDPHRESPRIVRWKTNTETLERQEHVLTFDHNCLQEP